MKKLILILCISVFAALHAYHASAQAGLPENISEIAYTGESEGWVYFKKELKLDPVHMFQQKSRAFGLGNGLQMQVTKVESDKIGMTHHRYQQTYMGIPVEGSEFTVHSRNGIAEKGNGRLAQDLHVNVVPAVSKELAIERALECIGAETYNWERPGMEAALQNATGDANATFYPAPELMIADEDFDPTDEPSYALVWKMEINSYRPDGRKAVYIDARTGAVYKELDLAMHTNWEGTAETRFHGTRPIVTDSTDQGFRLRENGRGLCQGIETYDANDSLSVDYATDFWDDDNYWDNANAELDEIGGDLHWSLEMTYDYFFEQHDRNSFDNAGSKVIGYAHYGTGYQNATWNGNWAVFGDGKNSLEPYTTIDIVGHEIAHGVTDYTSDLVYRNESGALNESFSDIFGKGIEKYAMPETFSWIMGDLRGKPLRNMSNPGEFDNPDTYHGENWFFGAGDNGGVHYNSGVQNFWFYLLVEGGSGVNDNGDEYQVEALGWDTASAIAYRNQAVYLQRFSQYIDARLGSLEAAADLYGRCSDVYMNVANAWYAVGVGGPISPNDFGIIDIDDVPHCGLGEETISMTIRYYGCDTLESPEIPIRIQKTNPLSVQNEIYHYDGQVVPNQTMTFTFPNTVDFSRGGIHQVNVSTAMMDDPTELNNDVDFVTYNLVDFSTGKFNFEDYPGPSRLKDTMALFEGEYNKLVVENFKGVDSSYAIYIEGGNYELARKPEEGENVFNRNSSFGSQICFCMNTLDLDEQLELSFDLRQTYSTTYDTLYGFPYREASALRIMANGNVEGVFYPNTPHDDPFVRHTVDLSGYIGMQFDLCFETRTIMASWSDPDTLDISQGDRIFIDNLWFTGDSVETSVDNIAGLESMQVYPNPALGSAVLALDLTIIKDLQVSLVSLNGNVLTSESQTLPSGKHVLDLPVQGLPPGMYLVNVRSEDGISVQKLIVQ